MEIPPYKQHLRCEEYAKPTLKARHAIEGLEISAAVCCCAAYRRAVGILQRLPGQGADARELPSHEPKETRNGTIATSA